MNQFTYIPNNQSIYINTYKRTLPLSFVKNLKPEKLKNILSIDVGEEVPDSFIEALKAYSDAII